MNAANLPLPLLQTVLDGMEAHLCECLDRLREQEAELEVRRDHNATLFALLAQRDRKLARLRTELMHVRGILGEDLR
jgi:hypothetical protein